MLSRSDFQRVAAVGLFSLAAMLSGCGDRSTSQKSKPTAGSGSAVVSMPNPPDATKATESVADHGHAARHPGPEPSISEVDMQSLEVLRALSESWAVKGPKVVRGPKEE